MAVHEAVEEEIVHPYVKRRVQGAAVEVDHLLDEEREVKQLLVALDALGTASPGFLPLFEQFRATLLAHAAKEEGSEFAGLREKVRPAERTAMAAAVRVASALAPTHPHPGLESGPRSVLIGTPLAMIDRARDVIRDAMTARARSGDTGSPGSGSPPDGT